MNKLFYTGVLLFIVIFSACNVKPDHPVFHASGQPQVLSDWNIFHIKKGTLKPKQNVVTYSLNTALFSDYAYKLRTVSIPDGMLATTLADGRIDFPIGTIISKTFYYPKEKKSKVSLNEQNEHLSEIDLKRFQIIETRLLVKRTSGWTAFPYVWDSAQQDATLARFGQRQKLIGIDTKNNRHDFTYQIPDVNQCAACHEWNEYPGLQPIGLQIKHLYRKPSENFELTEQLDTLTETHLTDISTHPKQQRSLSHSTVNSSDYKAREYLDINCAHCHNPEGPANTSGLYLESERPLSNEVGICKLPIAAGAGTGNRHFDIHPGKPEDSIVSYRIASIEPDKMMPEIGRNLRHTEGVKLIDNWIASLDDSCIIQLEH